MAGFAVEESERADGLRIITRRVPHTKRVRVAVMVRVGSGYDPPGSEGLFHFFEHMAFRGTLRRSAAEIYQFRDQYLLDSNASTGRTDTTYYGEVVYTRLESLCDFLFDIYGSPLFPDEAIKKEKGVVENEIARHEDNDHDAGFWGLMKLLYAENPARTLGTGSPETVATIDRQMLMDAHRQWYVPANTLMIGTGRIEHAALTALANACIPLRNAICSYRSWSDEYDMGYVPSIHIIERPHRKKAVVTYGCKLPVAVLRDEKNQMAFKILARMLARGVGSMLWQEIREQRGFAYLVQGGLMGGADLAYIFWARTEVKPPRVDETLRLIPDIIAYRPLERAHFERVKENMMDHFLASMETPGSWQGALSTQRIKEDRPLSYFTNYTAKSMARLSRITFDHVVRLRELYFAPERLYATVVKPSVG